MVNSPRSSSTSLKSEPSINNQENVKKEPVDDTKNLPSMRITSTISVPLRYVCLGILVLQTSANVLLLRYTRTARNPNEPVYIASTAVLMSEVLKITICLIVLLKEAKYQFSVLHHNIYKESVENWKDGLKLLIPALMYVVQNNLLYLALSNLDAATYQVTYQLKILSTAMFSVAMLGRRLSKVKWLALFVLMIGVILVQWPSSSSSSTPVKDVNTSSRFFGLVYVLCACVSSGFSGVYFEKLLKGSPISLWMRNLQLAFFSILIAILGVLLNDLSTIYNNGFFQGYNKLVFAVILLQGVGGLIIGAVVKYADNILKGFATSVSIVVSSIISYYLLGDFEPTWFFFLGSSGVLLATYIYSLPAFVISGQERK